MRRLIGFAVAFAVVALGANASNIERVYIRSTPSIVQAPVRDVLHAAREAGDAMHLDDVRAAGVRIHDELSGVPVAGQKTGATYLLCGDSMMETIAPAMSALLAAQNIDTSTFVSRGSSIGGALWDWESDMRTAVKRTGADVVVVMLDGTARTIDGYSAQVESVARAALGAGAERVIWLERPVTLDREYEQLRSVRNGGLRLASRHLPGLGVLDATLSLMPSSGAVSSYVTLADGEVVKVRDRDGVHLTDRGAQLFAQEVVDQLSL
jgi:hypothetical protein